MRSVLVRAPHVRLLHLSRLDERIAAHLDGVGVAGQYGIGLAHQALERPGAGEVFVATVRAIENQDVARLDKLLAIAEALPSSQGRAALSLRMDERGGLAGSCEAVGESAQPWRQEVGLAACAMHAVDPGLALARALRDDDVRLRSRALLVAGRCGRRDLVNACVAALADEEDRCAFEAARSGLLLGDRAESLRSLKALAIGEGGMMPMNILALCVLKVVSPEDAQTMLAALADDPTQIRTLIRGIAIAGDPHFVPWLIAQMEELSSHACLARRLVSSRGSTSRISISTAAAGGRSSARTTIRTTTTSRWTKTTACRGPTLRRLPGGGARTACASPRARGTSWARCQLQRAASKF